MTLTTPDIARGLDDAHPRGGSLDLSMHNAVGTRPASLDASTASLDGRWSAPGVDRDWPIVRRLERAHCSLAAPLFRSVSLTPVYDHGWTACCALARPGGSASDLRAPAAGPARVAERPQRCGVQLKRLYDRPECRRRCVVRCVDAADLAAGVILSPPSNVSLGTNQTVRNVLFLPASSAYTSSGRLVSTVNGSTSTSIAPLFSAAGGQVAAQVGFVSTGSSSAAIQSTLDPTLKALYFQSGLFIGEQTLVTASNTTVALATAPSGSLIMPGSSFAVIAAGDARIVAYDSSPDLSQWPVGGAMALLDAQSTSCAQACGIGGSCGSDGKCACADGFTGTLCRASTLAGQH